MQIHKKGDVREISMKVLQEKIQINAARQELIDKGCSVVTSPLPLHNIFRRLGFDRRVMVGDLTKSWDVLNTVNFLEDHVKRNDPILDIGCYASETIVALHKLGYSNLTGADLNPHVHKMPFHDFISYEISDFMHTKFADASFSAITSISVIEHGFDGASLLKEMSRLLKPNGYFIASFDYWPDKIDTTGVKFFGMDWMIFSKQDVECFVSEAAKYSMFPVDEIQSSAKEKVANWGGQQYTFAWLVLEKGA
jgi:SAM-dependent methyltransferase